jgi:hypothetical protein
MPAWFTIFAGTRNWLIARIDGDGCRIAALEAAVGLKPEISAVVSKLKNLGYQGEGVMFALPSRWCLCASVSEKGLRGRERAQDAALRFRLEEQLPLALEELTVDFIRGDEDSLGVVVQTAQVAPLVNALEDAGVSIVSICPTALLAAAHGDFDHAEAIAMQLDNDIDVIQFHEGRIRQWRLYSIADSNLPERIKDPLDIAAHVSARMLSGDLVAPVDFRRDDLRNRDPLQQIRQPLFAAVLAAVLLSICLSVAMLWRAHQYDRVVQAAEIRQLAAFRMALPNQAPPPSVLTRLMSEEKRLQGMSRTNSSLPPELSLSVLPLMRDTLASMPNGLRFKVVEMRFEPQQLYLEGQTLIHGDADQIAAALRHGTGLQVDPPHTEQPVGEDVTFTISASDSHAEAGGDAR